MFTTSMIIGAVGIAAWAGMAHNTVTAICRMAGALLVCLLALAGAVFG